MSRSPNHSHRPHNDLSASRGHSQLSADRSCRSPRQGVTRRGFLQGSLAAGATFVISGTKSSGQVLGANDAIRLAVAGINGRGSSHIEQFGRMADVRITYLIDPDRRLFEARSRKVQDVNGTKPKTVQDFRDALDDPNLDAISIATCNHWHAPMTIFACQAGKDVYVEKPCSHNVHEGRVAVQMARKHGRIVQHGTQSRSSRKWAAVQQYARSGHFGKLLISHGIASKPRGGIGVAEPKTPPDELDFNLWLGPAPEQPYHENLVHYNWHWFWDFGNGEIGNQGVHQMDIARWAIPGATLPTRVLSIGGRFGYQDQGETPNTQLTVFEFGDTLLVFEVCGLVDGQTRRVDNDFYFEQGSLISGGRFVANDGGDSTELPPVEVERGPGGNIFRNFIEALRSRNVSHLDADILDAHYSSALCHLGNLSYRLGTEVPFRSKSRPFGDHDYANQTWERLEEHLAKNRGLKLESMSYRVGRALRFDPTAERFVDDPQADQLLTRQYRKPFVIPDGVA